MKAAVAGVALIAATMSMAGNAAHADDHWEFVLTPYLWAQGIEGDISLRGRDADVNASFGDLLENLDAAAAFMFEASKGRWVNWVQFDYSALSMERVGARGVEAELESKTTMFAVGTGYRFDVGARSTLDVLVGVRGFDMDNSLELRPLADVSTSSTAYDAIVALRPRIRFGEHWSFNPTLSVGSGDSDLTWELQPQFVYSCSYCDHHYEIRFGYRNLDYKTDKGNAKLDIAFRGPLIGFGWRF